MSEKRTLIVLAAAAGVLAGLAACGARQADPAAPSAPRSAAVSGERAEAGSDLHGCGHHEGDSCGAHDDDKR